MKIRTLLLGTATAFAAVNGAQAADLAVAEPVDYVKVCDAYGAGYFYIPGSDTCLKIGGYVKGYVDFYDTSSNKLATGVSTTTVGTNGIATVVGANTYPSSWDWTTETSVNVTAQSMTDIGLLTAFIDYRAVAGNSYTKSVYMDSAYLKAGPVKIGAFTSIYMYGGSFGEIGFGSSIDAADTTTNQIAFSTSMGGLGVWLGLADNRAAAGASSGAYASNWPDVILALTGAAGGFDWKLAAAATDTTFGTGWGAQFGATYTLASGDALRGKVAVGNTAGSFYVDNTAPTAGGTIWSAMLAGVHYWSSNVSSQLAATYTSNLGGVWNVGAETDWLVAKNFLTAVGVNYFSPVDPNGSKGEQWQVELRAVRTF